MHKDANPYRNCRLHKPGINRPLPTFTIPFPDQHCTVPAPPYTYRMAKPRTIFACKSCGCVQTKWLGKCPDCNTWDSLEAQRVEIKSKVDPRGAAVAAWGSGASGASSFGAPPNPFAGPITYSEQERAEALEGPDESEFGKADPAPLPSMAPSAARSIAAVDSAATLRRIVTGVSELDRVLGGGFVPGSAVMIGGDPGIGKSTLLLQVAGALAASGTRVLYVSSEESAEQVKLRASRLTVPTNAPPATGASEDLSRSASVLGAKDLFLLADTSLSRIQEQAGRVLGDCPPGKPPVLVIDSIQMIYKADLDAFPGSITQLRRCCAELVYMAKASGVTVILVGHVTKDGQLAGPRLLEHLVDTVLYFEGDRYHAHRIVRAVKNRFGSTLELGLFEMTGSGLQQATEGVTFAAMTGDAQPRPGTVCCPVMTGTRCLLVEIQALTATGFPGNAKRKSSGLDASRLAMLIAVLEQHAGLRLADRDIFASAVGGVKIAEPGADLALLLAIAGAHNKRSLAPGAVVMGEVGLGGEVRPVPQIDQRLSESARLGFKVALIPASKRGKTKPVPTKRLGMDVIEVRSIADAIDQLG